MIHPTAIIDASAKIADDVEIGPFCVIGADVEIGAGTKIEPHVTIGGPTKIGEDNHIFPYANVGADCQDKKYAGERTELVIGDRNVIRENVTIHRGTVQDHGITTIGNDNLLMVGVHVAHDVVIGDQVILVNQTQLAGHVHIGDYAILSGATLVHQFVKIGSHVMVAGGSVVHQDIPSYVTCNGSPAKPYTINNEGLKRRGFDSARRGLIKRAYKTLYRQGLQLEDALEQIKQMENEHGDMACLVQSIEQSTRGIIR